MYEPLPRHSTSLCGGRPVILNHYSQYLTEDWINELLWYFLERWKHVKHPGPSRRTSAALNVKDFLLIDCSAGRANQSTGSTLQEETSCNHARFFMTCWWWYKPFRPLTHPQKERTTCFMDQLCEAWTMTGPIYRDGKRATACHCGLIQDIQKLCAHKWNVSKRVKTCQRPYTGHENVSKRVKACQAATRKHFVVRVLFRWFLDMLWFIVAATHWHT